MRCYWLLLMAAAALVGCQQEVPVSDGGEANMVLAINWQRLVTDDGETCDRCGGTQDELHKAIGLLQESLRPLGIEVSSVESPLSVEECAADIMQSNRIVIGDRPLEEWLGGEVGKSLCGSCCGAIGEEVECRAVLVDGSTYEVIPAELIVRAGLLAASQMMNAPSQSPCCPEQTVPCDTDSPCCPGAESDEGAAA
jgi:hypothetical protein